MRLLGMAMTAGPLIALVLYNLYQIEPYFSHSGFSGFEFHFSIRIFAGAVVLAVPGALLWAVGWVVDGFFKEPQ